MHNLKDKMDFKDAQCLTHLCILWDIIPFPLPFRGARSVWEKLCLGIIKVTSSLKTLCPAWVPPTAVWSHPYHWLQWRKETTTQPPLTNHVSLFSDMEPNLKSGLLGRLQKISLHWKLKRSISGFSNVLNERESGRNVGGCKRKASKKSTEGLCKPTRLEEVGFGVLSKLDVFIH